MGIFDSMGGGGPKGGLLDPYTLLALSAAIGEASAPSTTPRSLGPAIGKGAFQAAQLRQAMAQQDMQRKLYELQAMKLQKDMAKKPNYRTIKGADGYGYWLDGPSAGQRVLPDVKAPAKKPEMRTYKTGGVEVTEERDPATGTWREVGRSGVGVVAPEALAQKMKIAGAGRPQNVGTIPAGYQLETEGGVSRMVPIPGSPAAQKMEDAKTKDQRAATSKGVTADIVLDDINRAFKVMDGATLPTTGVAGDLLSSVGGTAARDLRGLVDTIKANIGFDKLQSMRDASKTGGALGQVSEFENKMLQATMGNLEQSQSDSQFRYNLNRMRKVYTDIVHHGTLKRLADAGATPDVIDAFIDTTPTAATPQRLRFDAQGNHIP